MPTVVRQQVHSNWGLVMEQLELELVFTERCGNETCQKMQPISMFSTSKVNGKIYRRSWCKSCEAERERIRYKDVVRVREAIKIVRGKLSVRHMARIRMQSDVGSIRSNERIKQALADIGE